MLSPQVDHKLSGITPLQILAQGWTSLDAQEILVSWPDGSETRRPSRDGGRIEAGDGSRIRSLGDYIKRILTRSFKNEPPRGRWLWSKQTGPLGLPFQGVIVSLAFLGCNLEKTDYSVLLIHSTAYWFYMSSMYIVCLHYYQEKQEVRVVMPLPQPVIPCCALWEATDSYTWSRDNAT